MTLQEMEQLAGFLEGEEFYWYNDLMFRATFGGSKK
jgi:hypothetical protein